MTLVDPDRLAFEAAVYETDIALVAKGQAATVSLDSFVERIFTGRVTRIKTAAQSTGSGTVAFGVRVSFASGDARLFTGMSGSTDIEVEAIPDALSVPIESVLTDGGRTITLEAWSTLDGPGDSILSYTKFLAQGSFDPAAPFQLHAESRKSSQLSLSLTQRGGESFQTGDPGLDAAYAARSNDPARAAALMRNPRVGELLLRLSGNEAYLDLASDGGRWRVRFGDEDAPLSIARLRDARQLIGAVLDELAASGAARKP